MPRVMFLVGPEQVELREVPVPRPEPGGLLLEVEAALTCGTDVKVFRRGGHPRMLRVPTPFGHEMAGRVAEVGRGVERFAAGDRIVVLNSASCGECGPCRASRENLCERLEYLNGAFGEVLAVPRRFVERSVWPLPEGLPAEVAALTEPLACVLHGCDLCGLDGPSDLLLLGAGPIGLLFVGALAAEGHRVVVADPNPGRLEVAARLGAAEGVPIERGGGQAARARERSPGGRGFPVVIEATGVGAVWRDAIESAATGGAVTLFGGCAPGTEVLLDTRLLHYGELTLRGAYHHRPATARRALELLSRGAFDAGALLSAERPLEELEPALRSMIRKESLKVVVRPR